MSCLEINCAAAPFRICRKSRSGFNHEERFLGGREAGKIRELYRVICESHGEKSECELRKNQEVETEWEMSEESKKVNSADQIDLLGALRFKTQIESKKLSTGESEEILENGTHGMGERTSDGRNL